MAFSVKKKFKAILDAFKSGSSEPFPFAEGKTAEAEKWNS